jgi:biopolymer transport protein ExbD
MRLPVRAWIGLVALLSGCGLFAYSMLRLAPGTLVAVDLPVQIASGHVSSGPFELQREWGTDYYAEIVLRDAPRHMPHSCDPDLVLETAWRQVANGAVGNGRSGPSEYDRGLTITRIWGDYRAFPDKPVHHSIDVNFGKRAACLDAFHPRFKIQAYPEPSEDYIHANWLAMFLIALGIVLPVQAAFARRASDYALPRMLPELRLRQVIAWRTQRAIVRMSALPVHFVTVFAGLELVLITVFMTITPITPQGLTVDLVTRQIAKATDSPWPETLSLYARANGAIYLNGAEVAPGELRARLQQELNKRTVWIVYIEADNDVEAGIAFSMIDTVQGLGAQVFWITPAVRKEWSARVAHVSRTPD